MRFNSRELAHSVEQGPFDKEGTLLMKYKPEGRIFKKEESKILNCQENSVFSPQYNGV